MAWRQCLFKPKGDPAFAKVIWRHLYIDAVASKYPNAVFSHLATSMSKHLVIIVEFNAKHRVWQQVMPFHTPCAARNHWGALDDAAFHHYQ